MEFAASFVDLLQGFEQDPIGKEISLGNALTDAGQILVDDTAGADIEMSDLRVAHLPFR